MILKTRPLKGSSTEPVMAFFAFFVPADMRGYIDGAGQIVDYRVEKGLHALILESGAAKDGQDAAFERALPDDPLHVVRAYLFAVKKQSIKLVVDLG